MNNYYANHYRPQTKFAKVMFLHLSVHGGAGAWLPSVHLEGGVGFPVCTGNGGLHPGEFASRRGGGLHPGDPPEIYEILRDMTNERAVHILLECILVKVVVVTFQICIILSYLKKFWFKKHFLSL